jgi:hypothetical protein
MGLTTVTTVDAAVARSLATSTEPGASVYVNLRPAEPTANTGEDLALRWRQLAGHLAAQGADQATLAAIWRHLGEQPVSPARYAIFASRGSVPFHQRLPGAAGVDIARFGAPADVVPLLAFMQQHPPYVHVVADRTGADLTVVPRGAVTGSTSVVVGPDDEIERNAPGGWAQARYQRRAEDSWQHNAAAVAEAVSHALDRVDARLLLVAGDVRAVQLLRDHLPSGRGVVLRHLPGGRRPDSSGTVRDATADAVAQYATAQITELMDRFDSERRHGGLAVEGVAATLGALDQRRVHTLLVADGPDDERIAWFGPDRLCATTPSAPPQTTSWEAAGRLVDIAVRAAVLTGAEINVIPASHSLAPGERIGALCRFVQTAP